MDTNEKEHSIQKNIINLISKEYKASPEFLWKKYPNDMIFRHKDNKKWFALIMEVEKSKLSLNGDAQVDILNLKLPPEMIGLFLGTPGFYPAYHMNKNNWITILLDGSVSVENILPLLGKSFELTGSKKKKSSLTP